MFQNAQLFILPPVGNKAKAYSSFKHIWFFQPTKPTKEKPKELKFLPMLKKKDRI